MRTLAAIISLLAISATGLSGQSETPPSTVNASGNGLVEYPSDFAVVLLGVQIEASTPDTAARRMSQRLDRVTETLVALGIPRDSLPTSRLDVSPRTSNVGGSRVTTYQAQSLVRLRIWELDRVGEILSAAVAAGATSIERLDYRSTREREGHDEAIRLATEEANRNARIMAEAQGMELAHLVSTTSTVASIGFDRNLLVMSPITASRAVQGFSPAEIVPIGVSFSVHVSVEWEIR